MTVSLSFVLPVRNAEKTIARQVHHLLDVLSELTERFEILVMDEGSTDHTPEVARDLQRRFPQVRLAAGGPRDNPVAALESCVAQAAGELVLVDAKHGLPHSGTLRGVWAERAKTPTGTGPAMAVRPAARSRVVYRLEAASAESREPRTPSATGAAARFAESAACPG